MICGTIRPAGFFAYPGKPSTPDDPDTRLIELATAEMDVTWTLQALAGEPGEAELGPEDFVPMDLPDLPTGNLTGTKVGEAVDAAVACPDRKVVVMEGDGLGMYTLQSLWTMARQGLDVTTVIFANRSYQILRDELAAVGVTEVGRNISRMFDVDTPMLDWVALAKGHGVQAIKVADMAGFNAAFAKAMGQRGPRLIEVIC